MKVDLNNFALALDIHYTFFNIPHINALGEALENNRLIDVIDIITDYLLPQDKDLWKRMPEYSSILCK